MEAKYLHKKTKGICLQLVLIVTIILGTDRAHMGMCARLHVIQEDVSRAVTLVSGMFSWMIISVMLILDFD